MRTILGIALIRASAILHLLLAVGHTSAYPWAAARDDREIQLVDSMRSVAFVFAGERSTYWNLYFGWGVLVAVLLVTLAIVLWLLSDLARLAPRRVGGIAVLLSASSLVGAYLAFRFFYVPPCIFFSLICLLLLIAAVQLVHAAKLAATP
jgi:hypothetical protein